MRVILKAGILTFSVENDDERAAFAIWRSSKLGHVFSFESETPKGGSFHDIGLREDACREPINIVFEMRDDRLRLIGNLALTPFVLRAKGYASVEGFWQGLKFTDEADRRRVASLWGKAAKAAAYERPAEDRFFFDGAEYTTGSAEHRALMLEACRAKFTQNLEAREALQATGERPLTHRVRRDSTTIPGAILADFWMRIRRSLQ